MGKHSFHIVPTLFTLMNFLWRGTRVTLALVSDNLKSRHPHHFCHETAENHISSPQFHGSGSNQVGSFQILVINWDCPAFKLTPVLADPYDAHRKQLMLPLPDILPPDDTPWS
jgi:hypothetical protein